MTFRRGASLTTATTLGFAASADLGPTEGNGFGERWADDLALLHQLGVADIRLTLDWARLQTKPGELDADWSERFTDILVGATSIGLRTWATLSDGSIPRWFDNEGGFADDEAFVKWWPRWVERAADTFGDRVEGWVPFDVLPAGAAQPWRDTWGILGGTQPVIASIGADASDRIEHLVGRMDLLGVELAPPWGHDESISDEMFEEVMDRWGNVVRRAADEIDGKGVAVAGFRQGHDDADMCGRITEVLTETLDDALADGANLEVAFIEPAIAGRDGPPGLLDVDRAPTPTADAFRPK